MKTFKNVIKIVLICLGVAVLGSYAVIYLVNPTLGKQIMDNIVLYANKPLPIVGVSALVLSVLVWKIFQASTFGKKAIAQMKAEYESEKKKLKEENEKNKNECVAIIASYQKEADIIYEGLIEVCNSSVNKKVKLVGKKLSTDIRASKEQLRSRFNEIVSTDIEQLINSKEEMINKIVELVKKEVEEKYGEGKKAIERISEEKKI